MLALAVASGVVAGTVAWERVGLPRDIRAAACEAHRVEASAQVSRALAVLHAGSGRDARYGRAPDLQGAIARHHRAVTQCE